MLFFLPDFRITLVLSCFVATARCNIVRFYRQRDWYAEGTIIKKVDVNSIMDCLAICSRRPDCYSFNAFERSTTIKPYCELLSTNHCGVPKTMVHGVNAFFATLQCNEFRVGIIGQPGYCIGLMHQRYLTLTTTERCITFHMKNMNLEFKGLCFLPNGKEIEMRPCTKDTKYRFYGSEARMQIKHISSASCLGIFEDPFTYSKMLKNREKCTEQDSYMFQLIPYDI